MKWMVPVQMQLDHTERVHSNRSVNDKQKRWEDREDALEKWSTFFKFIFPVCEMIKDTMSSCIVKKNCQNINGIKSNQICSASCK